MRKNPRVWVLVLGGGILAVLLVAIGVYLFLDDSLNPDMSSIPVVSIREVFPEGSVFTDQDVIVFGQAQDPDGIAEIQLWVNGQKIASQVNPDPAQDTPFMASQAWIPTGVGNYLFLFRAVDRQGVEGQSPPVMVRTKERSFTYTVLDGETAEGIAAQFGTTVADLLEINPDLGPAPTAGSTIYVYPAPPSSSSGGPAGSPGSDGLDGVPRVDPPAPAPVPSEIRPAELLIQPWWRAVPFVEDIVCVINPARCSVTLGGGGNITPPMNVSATMTDTCSATITFQDTAEYETGFRIYRTSIGPRIQHQLVAILRESPGDDRWLSYVDPAPYGDFFYSISAFDSTGEYWSPPSPLLSSSCLPTASTATSFVSVEALELIGADSYDRLYCYFSLAGSPYERVPLGSQFIVLESGVWNISEFLSGSNKRVVGVDASGPLSIQAECLGWEGATLVNLGRFSRSHDREDWDGRLLTAGPPDGSFSVVYRIQHTSEAEDEYGTGFWPIIDSRVPSPFNLRTADDWSQCEMFADDFGGCGLIDEPGIRWDYEVFEGAPQPPLYFKVYLRTVEESVPHLWYTTTNGFSKSAPRTGESCNLSVYYTVSAVVGYDMFTGEEIESAPSLELEIPPTCGELEITLGIIRFISAYDGEFIGDLCFDDCGPQMEVYGWFGFNGQMIRWNNHCDAGFGEACLTSGPGYTAVVVVDGEGDQLHFADEWMNNGNGHGLNHNVIRIPIQEGQSLQISFGISDHDPVSSDDFYCGWDNARGALAFTLPARTLEEWLSVEENVWVSSPSYTNCEVSVQVRGVP